LLDSCNIDDNNSENKYKTLVETSFYHQYWGKKSFLSCFILMYYFSDKFWSHPKLISFMIKLQLLMLRRIDMRTDLHEAFEGSFERVQKLWLCLKYFHKVCFMWMWTYVSWWVVIRTYYTNLWFHVYGWGGRNNSHTILYAVKAHIQGVGESALRGETVSQPILVYCHILGHTIPF
jgi:hypothetical protein